MNFTEKNGAITEKALLLVDTVLFVLHILLKYKVKPFYKNADTQREKGSL